MADFVVRPFTTKRSIKTYDIVKTDIFKDDYKIDSINLKSNNNRVNLTSSNPNFKTHFNGVIAVCKNS